MSCYDILAIIAYFIIIVSAGFWFRRKAARNLEAYFLGGKSLHWSMLAMSGAVSNFDITGTMWMVSVLYVLGMQSWWHHWMWGGALPAFTRAYMARWVRRSRVMTAAEWMKTRFGSDRGGRVARYASAVMSILFTAAAIGYAFQGIGKFAAVYLPLESVASSLPFASEWIAANEAPVLATLIFAITTLYVAVGGLYSVVVTDVIQTVILTAAGIIIAVIAYTNLTPEIIASSVPGDFTRLAPSWRLDHLAGTENAAYQMFGLLTIAWVLKGLLMNAGGPAQLYDFQRHIAAASVRDACKLAASWPFFLVIRWGMVCGITLLALSGVMNSRDPETVMPAVLQEYLPVGIRGAVIAGLLAAFMSTFSSTVNSGAAFIVRDIWQPIFRPDADERHLVRCSYVATVAIVVAGIAIGFQFESIAAIWGWMMMALGASIIVPNVLRWYWWRLNGWGYAAGVVGGILLSILALFFPEIPIYKIFPAICGGSLLASVLVTLWTAPTDAALLQDFFRTVKPFGFWKPVRAGQDGGDADPASASRSRSLLGSSESAARAVLNTILGIIGLTSLYLCPMYLVGHWHTEALLLGGCFLAAAVILAFTWYRHLPVDE